MSTDADSPSDLTRPTKEKIAQVAHHKIAQNNTVKKKSSKGFSAPPALNKSVINVIRTTQRNNIDLKHIADNKANILMSINALMITFMFPIVLSNRDMIIEMRYWIPLLFLATTCFVTVILSALVLRPFSNRGRVMRKMTEAREKSPFFFENYDKMEVEEYYTYFCNVSQDEDGFFKYVIEDLHYYGKILSLKYEQIKQAYTVFIIGIMITAFAMLFVLW